MRWNAVKTSHGSTSGTFCIASSSSLTFFVLFIAHDSVHTPINTYRVQSGFYGDNFPNSPVPLKSCVIPVTGDPKDVAKERKKACDDCKKSMKFKLDQGNCDMYSADKTSPMQDTKPHKGGFLETEATEGGPMPIPMATYNDFATKGMMYGIGKVGDQEAKDKKKRPADYVTQLERCLNLADAAKKKFGKMEKDFAKRSCACLGCCAPDVPNGPEDCPWPTTMILGR
jgi:hypothetical protein